MRTLTKERVDTSRLFNSSETLNQGLILDGPMEIIHQKSRSYREINLADFKNDFRNNFISHAASELNLNLDQATELINSSSRSEINCLEQKILIAARKNALIIRILFVALESVILGSWLGYLGNVMFFIMLGGMILAGATLFFPIMGLICMLLNLYDWDFPFCGSMAYIRDRKYLVKIYGDKFMDKIFVRDSV